MTTDSLADKLEEQYNNDKLKYGQDNITHILNGIKCIFKLDGAWEVRIIILWRISETKNLQSILIKIRDSNILPASTHVSDNEVTVSFGYYHDRHYNSNYKYLVEGWKINKFCNYDEVYECVSQATKIIVSEDEKTSGDEIICVNGKSDFSFDGADSEFDGCVMNIQQNTNDPEGKAPYPPIVSLPPVSRYFASFTGEVPKENTSYIRSMKQ